MTTVWQHATPYFSLSQNGSSFSLSVRHTTVSLHLSLNLSHSERRNPKRSTVVRRFDFDGARRTEKRKWTAAKCGGPAASGEVRWLGIGFSPVRGVRPRLRHLTGDRCWASSRKVRKNRFCKVLTTLYVGWRLKLLVRTPLCRASKMRPKRKTVEAKEQTVASRTREKVKKGKHLLCWTYDFACRVITLNKLVVY